MLRPWSALTLVAADQLQARASAASGARARAPARDSIAFNVATWRPYAWLVLAALVPYAGTWTHGFINYDDGSTILGLPLIRTLNLAALPGFFRPDVYAGLPEYMPLKNLSYAVDHAIFGLSAPGFRVQQQIWYVAAVLATFVWLRAVLARLAHNDTLGLDASSAPTLALVTAMLFAVHPAHVESVTWLSGRKDLLCGAFMPAALAVGLAWSGGSPTRDPWRLAGALVLTALALLSKPMAIVLPALFVLQDRVCAAPSTRTRSLVRERAALYAGSALLCLAFAALYQSLTRLLASKAGVAGAAYAGPDWARWGQQLGAFAWLSWLPTNLVPVYPPEVLDPNVVSWRVAAGLAWLAALVGGAAWSARRSPPMLLAIGLFTVPVLPIVARPVWDQYVANRYLFHAVAGTTFALTWGAARLVHARPRLRPVIALACVGLVGAWTFTTVDYNRAWRDGSTLWRYALTVYPRFTYLHELGASAALQEGHMDAALGFLGRCVEVAPDNATCAGMLGGILLQPDPVAGEALLRRALPGDREGIAHLRLAQHLANTGRGKEAVALYERFLHGRTPAVAEIAALAGLALADHQLDKALVYARAAVAASALNHPASPPPVETVLHVARARRDVALEQRARAAGTDCARSDCFKQHLGW